jgi:hypothetical protein
MWQFVLGLLVFRVLLSFSPKQQSSHPQHQITTTNGKNTSFKVFLVDTISL